MATQLKLDTALLLAQVMPFAPIALAVLQSLSIWH